MLRQTRTVLLSAVLAMTLALPACAASPDLPTTTDSQQITEDWQLDTTFYLLFVRSFADSTTGPLAGDGVGDLRGLIERLDYLNDGDPATTHDLGVTGLWLLPIAQAPSYHGYDTTDYLAVDDEYGTEADLRELLAACHERGIRVLFDLVLNHCSNQHPWFVESADPASDKRDWFVWRDEQPEQRGPWGQPVWHTLDDVNMPPASPEHATDSYYGVFWSGMPDLNFTNPAVTAAMHDAASFWLDEIGFDGFRLDAIKYLIEDGDTLENTQATIDWFRDFTAHVESTKPNAWMVGEVWDAPEQIKRYIAPGNHGEAPALASCFDFPFAYAVMEGLRDDDVPRIRRDLARSWNLNGPSGSTFLSNHDMDRSFPFMGGSTGKAKAAASLLLTSPGVPFVYYGEELGQIGNGPHERIRTPMPWTADPDTVGFTTGTPWEPPHPNMDTVSVQAQTDNNNSLLSHYRTMIRLRDANPALRRGDHTLVSAEDDPTGVVAYLRSTDEQRLLVIVNASARAESNFRVDAASLGLDAEATVTDLLTGAAAGKVLPKHADKWRPIPSIAPYAVHVLELD